MKIFMIIFIMFVAMVELLIIAGCFTSVKYQIEVATDTSVILDEVYDLLSTLSFLIIFDLLYLGVMNVLYFKK